MSILQKWAVVVYLELIRWMVLCGTSETLRIADLPLDRVIDENHEFCQLLTTVDAVRLVKETFAFRDDEREVEDEGEGNTWPERGVNSGARECFSTALLVSMSYRQCQSIERASYGVGLALTVGCVRYWFQGRGTFQVVLANGAPCSGSANIIETPAATGAVLFTSDDGLHVGWR